ncbi:hypothetical protein C438_06977 [Haloferax denitrificans ATCC 35960]|uniref:Uncharacterized protein n=1 Tax=Haloferax denitrificans ATCC 35960 TaxID=662478 RepID=M0JFH7_9EURY|nr:hypothetical protein C438_06977 [Haloferax denitrificans ATCC 35960]
MNYIGRSQSVLTRTPAERRDWSHHGNVNVETRPTSTLETGESVETEPRARLEATADDDVSEVDRPFDKSIRNRV